MTSKKSFEIWKEVKGKAVGCYEDAFGNCPCDYGYPCDKCSAEWIQEAYRKALAEAENPSKKKLFSVIIHDIAEYDDIQAENEDEAIEIALEWWYERQPYWKVIEEK